ncbi:stress protein [Streptomyces paludis]|uniref:Stress protein n=1 Tax=Streptomyces paludis TaxID=2282738 RepID=A0A345HRT3_9ACTN|nr:stress protein [Streptomyces paludis]AXG79407.1 stress protein [Streptomyces paludis]
MRRNTALVSVALTGLALAGGLAAPAQAATGPASTAATAAANAATAAKASASKAPTGGEYTVATVATVTIHGDQLGRGKQVTDAIRSVTTNNRGDFVNQVKDKIFTAAGGRHNVMVFNLSQNHKDRFNNVRLYANVKWDKIHYGVWIFESGEFTNLGDGGWINWGFRGWFDRNDKHVKFRRSW